MTFDFVSALMINPLVPDSPFSCLTNDGKESLPKRLVGMSFGIEQRRSRLAPILGRDKVVFRAKVFEVS